MCGRFVLYDVPDIAKRLKIDVGLEQLKLLKDNYNVAPGQYMPVIIDMNNKSQVDIMRWGLIPHWAKDEKIGYKLINTRAESAFEKPAWRSAMTRRRCLVPARGFYEWQLEPDGKSKQPFYIYPKDQELFCFAGIWESWHAPDGGVIRSFSILTTEPNKEMRPIHNRMPVILPAGKQQQWINSSLTEREAIEDMLQPYPDGLLEMHPVSTEVNSVKHNSRELIYAL